MNTFLTLLGIALALLLLREIFIRFFSGTRR